MENVTIFFLFQSLAIETLKNHFLSFLTLKFGRKKTTPIFHFLVKNPHKQRAALTNNQ
jgi:hypothetical protein